jgi:hypothetical protein
MDDITNNTETTSIKRDRDRPVCNRRANPDLADPRGRKAPNWAPIERAG